MVMYQYEERRVRLAATADPYANELDYIDLKTTPSCDYGIWRGESVKRWYDGYIK